MCLDASKARECAVKFFLSRAAFERESNLYRDRSLPMGRFLPEVFNIIDSAAVGFTDAHGIPMPPCIIMEKGESLDLWAARDGVDTVTGLQVRGAPVATRAPL
jgi:hypothetical protein